MAIDWRTLGADFQQKYEGTFCRYTSPLSKKKEVFLIHGVEVNLYGPPTMVLYNEDHGEIYLTYNTEAELDFSYPDIGYFQHGSKALRFVRNYERQWRKGLCASTGRIIFPYDSIREVSYPQFTTEIVANMFKPIERKSIEGAKKFLVDNEALSVLMTKSLALGVGNKEGEYWVWFEDEPVGELKANTVLVKVPDFKQEIQDFLRDTGDYARPVV